MPRSSFTVGESVRSAFIFRDDITEEIVVPTELTVQIREPRQRGGRVIEEFTHLDPRVELGAQVPREEADELGITAAQASEELAVVVTHRPDEEGHWTVYVVGEAGAVGAETEHVYVNAAHYG